MDQRPKNLRSMLARAKGLSEVMVDIAYGALYFDEPEMVTEIESLERQMSDLILDMRAICVLAVRSPKNARGMSSVLQVVSAIERIANDAVTISRITKNDLGIPIELVVELFKADKVCSRVEISQTSRLANNTIESLGAPEISNVAVTAIRRAQEWIIGIDKELTLDTGDVLILVGTPEGTEHLRELAGGSVRRPPEVSAGKVSKSLSISEAVDSLLKMKELSDLAIDLAYSSLTFGDRILAAEVRHLESLLDELRDQLEVWILNAAVAGADTTELRGLMHLASATEDIGDQASQMVWTVERGESHPILGIAISDSEKIAVRYPVKKDSKADNARLGDLQLASEHGFTILTIRRGLGYIYEPDANSTILADDELIILGPTDSADALSELLD